MAVDGMIKVFAAAAIAELVLLLFLYERFWLPVIIIGARSFRAARSLSGCG